MSESDTIVAAATPAGESALAVIRASGPRVRDLAAEASKGRPPPARRSWHGDYTSCQGALIDDVVYSFFPSPRSFTGEDVLEISCHGNPFVVSKIIEDLCSRGCRPAQAGEFTRRAFLAGKLDLTEAEAVMDVIRARSDRALEAAQRQLRGALGRRVQGLIDRLLDVCAGIEAYIDFPEEDLPPDDRLGKLAEIECLAAEVRQMAATKQRSDLLRDGARVVLLGAPNAGKSSLLNRLAGFDRAIVGDEPGTTRDYLEERLTLGPHCIRVFDTAGLREASGPVERAGVDHALDRAAEADVMIFVADASHPPPTLPDRVRSLACPANALVALNKIDLGTPRFVSFDGLEVPVVQVSAKTGAGIDDFRQMLSKLLDGLTGCSADEESTNVNARHAEALVETARLLDQARMLLTCGKERELVGSTLRGALDALGTICGPVGNDAMLDRLFSRFCIGK